ncbi:hypothetical protein G4X40_04715 [Rhodococcus sp. D2-41]|uniref:Patatin-like phospholipase family protein n=1 Tax=Speluncibacter jeojiensis TaxID=2710754 RepID=A0A9X4M212_9ACTN|nr:patatin-like phospholipase family protein [Rhodococcus sp. D2-41]MDG3009446.1 hypothetical protein [Rhodococcus sp. D2-41]MDG3016374.1 patatin-like phospholipase family protein [Corynebacteriales bacterium D3-21]
MAAELRADLVCEGGGVRGIGLVGAVETLSAAGYHFPRAAGASAGAIVASLVAALQRSGQPMSRLREIVYGLDYRKFADSSLLGRVPVVGGPLSLLTSDGLHEGEYLEKLLGRILGELGVRTFGDLRTDDPQTQFAWSLVVVASDLSRRRMVRIPWDLPAYGLRPDEFPIARAVRASAAVPFFFRPVRVNGATWVDGGLLADFPVKLFDRPDSVSPQWPTFGIRLSARPGIPPTHTVHGPLSLALAALETLIGNQDSAYVDDPCTVRRTIFVPAQGISPIDFAITRAQLEQLYQTGTVAAQDFLKTWNFADYVAACRSSGRAASAG